MEGASKRVPFLRAGLLLAAPLAGESSAGKIRATAGTRVSVSIPALYGIRLLEEDPEASDPGSVVFASLPGRLWIRLGAGAGETARADCAVQASAASVSGQTGRAF